MFVHEGRTEIWGKDEELAEVQSGIKAADQNMQRIQLRKNTLSAQLGEVEKLYGRTAALLNFQLKYIKIPINDEIKL